MANGDTETPCYVWSVCVGVCCACVRAASIDWHSLAFPVKENVLLI